MNVTGVSKRIAAIKFAHLSPDEIRKMSTTKIITADTYDDDGFPIDMGLMDPHLGVIEPGLRCKTCGKKVDECPGHFGHIDLAMPVIHVGLREGDQEAPAVHLQVLRQAPAHGEQAAEYRKQRDRMEELGGDMLDTGAISKETARDAASRTTCPHCGTVQLKITLDKPTTFREEGHKLTPKEVSERLERIPDEDLISLGMDPTVSRPEWMILTALPVPPVTVQSVHHPRERRQVRGRRHAQARRCPEDQPEAQGEQGRGRAAAHSRGPVGAAPVPCHDLLRQPDLGHPAGQAQVRQAAQDAGPEAEGQGGQVQVEPVR